MSAAAKANEPANISQLTTMHTIIAGKISETRVHDGRIYTTIIAPSQDVYEMPSIVEVRSKGRIGQNGEEVRIKAKVGGFLGRPFNSRDPVTGQSVQVRQCRITLDLVE